MAAEAKAFDFTNVKERSEFNKKRQPEGDYRGRVTKVEDVKAKDETPQWLFTIEVGRGVYPYYCKFQENQYWKIRNLLIAAGKSVPKKRVKVDPNQIVGREIGVTLEDDEYEGRAQSNIAGVMPLSELDADSLADEDEDADTDDDDDEAPPPKKTKTKPKPAEDEDEDEEDEEEEAEEEENGGDQFDAMDRTQLKQYIVKAKLTEAITVKKSMSDDDIRAAIRSAEADSDEDDDLEEIDIDDA